MFTMKKIEQKFMEQSPEKYQRKFTYSNDNKDFTNFDINISETENETLNIDKIKPIEKDNINNKNIKKNLTKKNSFVPKKKYNKNKIYYLINDNNSTTTNCSDFKGIKKVTFSTVEIIRINKYKKFNLQNNFSNDNIQKNIIEVKNSKKNDDDYFCCIF